VSHRHRQLIYWAPPEPEPAPSPPARKPDDPMHGYTLAEMHVLARSAALANKWAVSDFTIRYEHAWDAIADALLTAAVRPSVHDLSAAGKGAVSRALLKDFCRTYGVADRDLTAGVGSAPRFAAYWFRPPGTPLDEAVAERVALSQAWTAIDARHATVLEALAVWGDNRTAAAALGMPKSSFSTYVSLARDAFEALWYDGETPPQRTRRPHRYSPSEWNTSRYAPCGTPGAFARHKRRGEPAEECGCAAAAAKHDKQRRAARKERAA
jgi:hypothetical protein